MFPLPQSLEKEPVASKDLHISWAIYHHTIEQLALKVDASGWKFNQILCLARGGLRVGDILSRLFHCPLAILSASSYGGENHQVRGELTIAPTITMTTSQLSGPLLVVDDLVDSGITLQETLTWLVTHTPIDRASIRTAVLWYKACSVVVPDYYVDYLADNPWIHQPFEPYDSMTLADLQLKHHSSTIESA